MKPLQATDELRWIQMLSPKGNVVPFFIRVHLWFYRKKVKKFEGEKIDALGKRLPLQQITSLGLSDALAAIGSSM